MAVKVLTPTKGAQGKAKQQLQQLQKELEKQGLRLVEMPEVKVKTIRPKPKPVSIEGVLGAVKKELQKAGYKLVGHEFQPAGNFTLCQVKVQKIGPGKRPFIVGTGVSKRNNLDEPNKAIGQAHALQYAVFGRHTQRCLSMTKEEKQNCKCLLRYPTSIMGKLYRESIANNNEGDEEE